MNNGFFLKRALVAGVGLFFVIFFQSHFAMAAVEDPISQALMASPEVKAPLEETADRAYQIQEESNQQRLKIGENVRLILRTESIRVMVPAVALNGGKPGDSIQVSVRKYGKTFRGTLLGDHTVEVWM